MTPELTVLAWSIVLGILQVLVAGGMATSQRGLRWNLSNRDGAAAPLQGAAARADRASRNFLETFVFFAAALVAVVIAQRNSAHTVLGAQVYLCARIAYFPVYIAGIPYVRTLIYAVSLWGILQLVEPLLGQ